LNYIFFLGNQAKEHMINNNRPSYPIEKVPLDTKESDSYLTEERPEVLELEEESEVMTT
jgi:hypothetical protein